MTDLALPADLQPRTESWLTRPAIAPLLRHRAMSGALGIGGAVQMLLTALHIGGIDCPISGVFGVPCPGCGLSRACVALVSGSGEWLRMHALAPLFVAAVALTLFAAAAPERLRERLAERVAAIERAIAFPALALTVVWFYWLARVLYAPDQIRAVLIFH